MQNLLQHSHNYMVPEGMLTNMTEKDVLNAESVGIYYEERIHYPDKLFNAIHVANGRAPLKPVYEFYTPK